MSTLSGFKLCLKVQRNGNSAVVPRNRMKVLNPLIPSLLEIFKMVKRCLIFFTYVKIV